MQVTFQSDHKTIKKTQLQPGRERIITGGERALRFCRFNVDCNVPPLSLAEAQHA